MLSAVLRFSRRHRRTPLANLRTLADTWAAVRGQLRWTVTVSRSLVAAPSKISPQPEKEGEIPEAQNEVRERRFQRSTNRVTALPLPSALPSLLPFPSYKRQVSGSHDGPPSRRSRSPRLSVCHPHLHPTSSSARRPARRQARPSALNQKASRPRRPALRTYGQLTGSDKRLIVTRNGQHARSGWSVWLGYVDSIIEPSGDKKESRIDPPVPTNRYRPTHTYQPVLTYPYRRTSPYGSVGHLGLNLPPSESTSDTTASTSESTSDTTAHTPESTSNTTASTPQRRLTTTPETFSPRLSASTSDRFVPGAI